MILKENMNKHGMRLQWTWSKHRINLAWPWYWDGEIWSEYKRRMVRGAPSLFYPRRRETQSSPIGYLSLKIHWVRQKQYRQKLHLWMKPMSWRNCSKEKHQESPWSFHKMKISQRSRGSEWMVWAPWMDGVRRPLKNYQQSHCWRESSLRWVCGQSLLVALLTIAFLTI